MYCPTLRFAALAVTFTLLFCSGAAAVDEPSTQFANVAPLPGGGVALDSDGKPDGMGALQINVPVAYTPGKEYFSLGFYGGNHIDEYSSDLSNGNGVLGLGFGRWPRLYISAMQVSSLLFRDSKAMSTQLQVAPETPKSPAIAFGIQDVLNKESDTDEGIGFYGVMTKSMPVARRDLFVTLGYGTGRFMNRPFGGVSIPLAGKFNFAVEYDGFQVNEAMAWRPGGRYGSVTVLAAYNNKCGWLIGANTQGNSPTWAQLAVGAALLAIKE